MNDHITIGESHLKAGRHPEALRSFELAIEFAPHDHRAIYFSALVHLKLDQEATALLLFNRALELDHDNATYLSDLAVTKVRLGDKQGAMRLSGIVWATCKGLLTTTTEQLNWIQRTPLQLIISVWQKRVLVTTKVRSSILPWQIN